jgi:dual specificity protein kinase YAK1
MPESENAGSGGCQGGQEQDGIFQSKHDGGICSGLGMSYFDRWCMHVLKFPQLNTKYDKNDEHHLLRLKDTFIHRQHLCLVFELLSVNLYELIKQNQFRGLSTTLVRVFAQQLLNGLSLLNKAHLIHCDLKPENILLKKLAIHILSTSLFFSCFRLC